MRVDVSPRRVSVTPQMPQQLVITIGNTSTVIGGYELRVLGADPSWVEIDTDRVSLFPDETRTVSATVAVPPNIPAGTRQIAIQVRELTPPHATSVAEVALVVPAAPSVQARLDPPSVSGGKKARYTVVIENTGNTVVRADLAAVEPEDRLAFAFEPERVVLAPGEHAVADMQASGKRPMTGSGAVRLINLYLDEVPADPFFNDQQALPPKHDETTSVSTAVFVQKARLTRGVFALAGLIAAITVFAVIITIALSKLVGQSNADRNLALQIAAAKASSAASNGTSAVSGTVRLLTSHHPVPGVTVALYSADDMSSPVATTATNDIGGYVFDNLDAGDYKLTYRGAGFLQLWYPTAADAGDASTIQLPAHHLTSGLDVSVGGVPATLTGTVSGGDLSGATLYLEKSVTDASAAGDSVVVAPPPPGVVTPTIPDTGAAIVKSVALGSDGSFALADVPSPSRYLLVLAKPGYATSTQTVDVGAGEVRNSIQLSLTKGDGLIQGVVSSGNKPLSGVTLTATSGTTSASTVSLSDDPRGQFTLGNLPTPATYTVVASHDGYSPQTMSLSLTAGQKLTGVRLVLVGSSGKLFGRVTVIQPDGSPDVAGTGVSVVITDGATTVTTTTQSTAQNSRRAGAWKVTGLPVPGDYTATFSRGDLASQTLAVSLDAFGNIVTGTGATTGNQSGLAVRLKLATGTVQGTVRQAGGKRVCDSSNGLGEAVVTLNSGSTSYTVTTASVPLASCGKFVIPNVQPGSYTLTVEAGSGTIPNSQSVQVSAGDLVKQPVTLSRPASITGTLTKSGGAPVCGWTVILYKIADFPNTVTAQTRTVRHACTGTFRFDSVDAGRYIVAASPTPDAVNAAVTKSIYVRPGEQFGTPADRTTFTIVVPT